MIEEKAFGGRNGILPILDQSFHKYDPEFIYYLSKRPTWICDLPAVWEKYPAYHLGVQCF